MTGESDKSQKEAILRLGKQRIEKQRKARERFRRMRQSRNKAAAPTPVKDDQPDPSVLLLMNDEQKQGLLSRLLTENGFRTLQADDLRSALALMSQEITEMMIVAPVQGAKTSIEILQKFRSLEKLRALPILVILSPKESALEERFCHTAGVKAIVRPFTHTQIAEALQALLDSSLAETSCLADDLTV